MMLQTVFYLLVRMFLKEISGKFGGFGEFQFHSPILASWSDQASFLIPSGRFLAILLDRTIFTARYNV